MSRTTRPTPTSNHLTTSFLLLAQYGGRAVIPVAEVCRDFFAPLTLDNFLRKVGRGDIALPVIRMEASQKTAKGVHISDLADFIDVQRETARREMEALCGGAGVMRKEKSREQAAMASQAVPERVGPASQVLSQHPWLDRRSRRGS